MNPIPSLRVLHLLAGQPQGGAEGFALRLMLALARRGVSQALLTRPDTPRLNELRAASVIVRTARFGTPLIDLPTRNKLHKTFAEFSPSVVLSYMNRANEFSKSLRAKNATLVGRLGGYYDLKYYRAADYLIGNTQDLVEHCVRSGWPRTRTIHLPNFAEVQTVPPEPREKHNTPTGVPLLLALGRFHDNKGFDVLLKAMAALPQTYLWLAGDGDLRDALTAQAKTLGIENRVRFLGWRTDTAALYRAADIFICPSRHEPLGNVILEAMAHGKPIVSTRNQGAQQLLQDGVTGKIVQIDDATALAKAVEELLDNPPAAQSMGQAAKAFYETHFSEAKVCDDYLKFFQQILVN